MPSWTHDRPTQDGYYWMRRAPNAEPEVMQIFGGAAREADVFVELTDADYANALWHGPLEPPPIDGVTGADQKTE